MKKLALVAALLVLGAACGDDDRSDYLASLEDPMINELDGALNIQGVEISEDTVRCSARATLDIIGEERLMAEGVTPENIIEKLDGDTFDDLDDEAATQASIDCFSRDEIIDLVVAGGDNDPGFRDAVECVVDNIGLEQFRQEVASNNIFGLAEDLEACGFSG